MSKRWATIGTALTGAAIALGTGLTALPAITSAPPPTHCQARGALPDPICTPGAIDPTLTAQRLCDPTFRTTTVRNVPESEKQAVYAEYGIASHSPGQYEVDHLISLELGGSNAIQNLWPEAAVPVPGFHQKDAVENQLHKAVCQGMITLPQAQQEIRTNWLRAYHPATAAPPTLEGQP